MNETERRQDQRRFPGGLGDYDDIFDTIFSSSQLECPGYFLYRGALRLDVRIIVLQEWFLCI